MSEENAAIHQDGTPTPEGGAQGNQPEQKNETQSGKVDTPAPVTTAPAGPGFVDDITEVVTEHKAATAVIAGVGALIGAGITYACCHKSASSAVVI